MPDELDIPDPRPLYHVVAVSDGTVRLVDEDGNSPNGWAFADHAQALNHAASHGLRVAWDYAAKRPDRPYPGPNRFQSMAIGMSGTLEPVKYEVK